MLLSLVKICVVKNWRMVHDFGEGFTSGPTAFCRSNVTVGTLNRTMDSEKKRNMIDETLLRRITVNPGIFGGKPIIRGMRISVELILSLLAQGETPATILADYPDLELDDLRACLAYAHAVIAHDKLDSVHIAG